MVQIRWSGRLGNRMLQYLFGGLVSKYSNTRMADPYLSTQFWHYDHKNFYDFFNVDTNILGKEEGSGPEHVLDDYWFFDNYKKLPELSPGNYICNGYFQSVDYFKHYEKDIKNFYQPLKPIQEMNGVLVHMRFGELEGCDSGSIEYYDKALTELQTNGGYIATMPELETDQKVKYLQEKYNLKFLNNSPVEILHLSRGFKKIVVGSGTFAWWIAYLSQAPQVYYYIVPPERAWHHTLFTGMGWKGLS